MKIYRDAREEMHNVLFYAHLDGAVAFWTGVSTTSVGDFFAEGSESLTTWDSSVEDAQPIPKFQ